MTQDLVLLDRGDDGVAVVTHPKVNALSRATLTRLAEVAESLIADPPGAVIVTGGDRVFAAGADITEFSGPTEAAEIGAVFRRAFDAVAAIPRVTIAAVAGFALGGGCELALSCDLRFCADTARFGQPEILLGIIPGAGGTQRLPRLVGASRAKDLILSGRQVRADEALSIGLVDRVFAADELVASTRAYAAGLAAGPLAAHALAKRAVDAGLDGPLSAGLDLEFDAFVEVFGTDDAGIGVASFLENGPGKANFTGR